MTCQDFIQDLKKDLEDYTKQEAYEIFNNWLDEHIGRILQEQREPLFLKYWN